MTLIAKDSGGGDFTQAPEGVHRAVCVQVIDLGMQYSEFYKKSKPKVLIGWQLTEVTTEDPDESVMVWKRYTVSLHENASLRKDLESWRGRAFDGKELEGFDITTILGVPCQIQVIHNDGFANVQTVMALPKGTQFPPATVDFITYDVDKHDPEVFATFSEKLQETINNSAERQAQMQQAASDGPLTGEPPKTDTQGRDIPF